MQRNVYANMDKFAKILDEREAQKVIEGKQIRERTIIGVDFAVPDMEPVVTVLPEKDYEEGDICGIDGCIGKMEYNHRGDGCSCFIVAPCSYCCCGLICSECGFETEHP